MLGMHVDPSMFKEDDVEILEDLVVAAHNDAKGKVETTGRRTHQGTDRRPAYPSRHETAVLIAVARSRRSRCKNV